MSEDRYEELMDQAMDLKDSPEKVTVLEEAVREADRLGDLECAFEARSQLVSAGIFSGLGERSLVAFGWCLAQSDADPERFPEEDLLWEFKWVLGCITEFPTIGRQQIEDLHENFEERLQRLNLSLRPAYYLRWINLMWMGRDEEAEPYVAKWLAAKNDWLADCKACELDSHITWLIRREEDAKAVRLAKPILEGKLGCEQVPHVTLAFLLRPLVRLGRLDEAKEIHKKGYRMVTKNQDFLGAVALHMLYRTSVNDLHGALRIFEKHLPWALQTLQLQSAFDFYLAALITMEKMLVAGKSSKKLRLPREFVGYQESGAYSVADLLRWLDSEVRALAERFETRNQTDSHTRCIAEWRNLAGLA